MSKYVQLRDSKTGEPVYPITARDTSEVIGVENGGTGAVNAEEALSNLGGVSIEELWVNPSGSSSFTTQTVPIVKNMEEYDFIAVRASIDAGSALVKTFICKRGDALVMDFARGTSASDKFYIRYRDMHYIDKNTLKFNSGYIVSPLVAEKVDEVRVIPLRIYGIKGVK